MEDWKWEDQWEGCWAGVNSSSSEQEDEIYWVGGWFRSNLALCSSTNEEIAEAGVVEGLTALSVPVSNIIANGSFLTGNFIAQT